MNSTNKEFTQIFEELIYASNLLIKNTVASDVLVFIGQSPNYLSYIVEKERFVIRVPCSGRFLIDEYTIPNELQLSGIKKLFDELGLSEEIISNKYVNIIFIDHSHSGQSISSFGKLLNILYDVNKRYDFINIVSPTQVKDLWILIPDFSVINTTNFLVMPILVAIANNEYPRSIPIYQYWKWTEEPNFTETKEGLIFVSNLMNYYNNIYLKKDFLTINNDIKMICPKFGKNILFNEKILNQQNTPNIWIKKQSNKRF